MGKISMIAVLTLTLACVAVAQPPQGGGPRGGFGGGPGPISIDDRVAMMTQQLNLTASQAASVKDILTDADTQLKAVRAQSGTLRTDLADAVKTNNTAKIETTAAELGAIEGKTIAIQSKSDARIYALLTPDQQELLVGLGYLE